MKIILTTPHPHICKNIPPKYAIQCGFVWHKSRLRSRDFYRKYGIRTQKYSIRTPPRFMPYDPFYWGWGWSLICWIKRVEDVALQWVSPMRLWIPPPPQDRECIWVSCPMARKCSMNSQAAGPLVVTIHFSLFTCCFRRFLGHSFTGFFPQRERRIHRIAFMFTIRYLSSRANGSPITPITFTYSLQSRE